MTGITEASIKKYWAVAVIVAGLVFGGAAWATKVNADIEALSDDATEFREDMKSLVREVRMLREDMIRAGTAKPAKGD